MCTILEGITYRQETEQLSKCFHLSSSPCFSSITCVILFSLIFFFFDENPSLEICQSRTKAHFTKQIQNADLSRYLYSGTLILPI